MRKKARIFGDDNTPLSISKFRDGKIICQILLMYILRTQQLPVL